MGESGPSPVCMDGEGLFLFQKSRWRRENGGNFQGIAAIRAELDSQTEEALPDREGSAGSLV